MSMANWHLNFYRDLSDVAGALRVDAENSANLRFYGRRFRSGSRPRSIVRVSNLYLVETTSNDPRTTSGSFGIRFQASRIAGATATALPALKAIPAPRPMPFSLHFPRGLAGWKFAANPVALVRPIASLRGTWLVVELDKKSFKPKCCRILRHGTSRPRRLDYRVAVVSGPEHAK
jgi:hypothetical protein